MSEKQVNKYADASIFNLRLKELRAKTGLTQTQFAEKAGLSKTAVSNYENLGKSPSLETLLSLADAYGVSLDWLCGQKKTEDDLSQTVGAVLRCLLQMVKDNTLTYELRPSLRGGIDENEPILSANFHSVSAIGPGYPTGVDTFFSRYDKMRTLLNDNIIDNGLFKSWVESQLTAYDGERLAIPNDADTPTNADET